MIVQPGRFAASGSSESATEALRPLVRVLLDDLEAVTDRLLNMIVKRELSYAQLSSTELNTLRSTIRANFEQGFQALTGEGLHTVDPAKRSRVTGQLRALQGIPLEAVLRGYRLGGRVVWEALLSTSREHFGGEYDGVLLEVASDLWRLIDLGSAELAAAYRAETRAGERNLSRANAFLDAILDGRAHDPAFFRGAAVSLGLPLEGNFLCVVAPTCSPQDEPLRAPQDVLTAKGIVSAWYARPTDLIGLVLLNAQTPETVLDTLKPAVTGPVGVSPPIDGLADLVSAYELARTAARTLTGPGLVTVDERLPEALLISSPERLVNRLPVVAFGDVLDLPRRDRAILLRTLRAVLGCNGSATRAARRLHCHRNTVLYRLQRIETLTGRTLGDSRDRMLLTLGIMALNPGSQADPGEL